MGSKPVLERRIILVFLLTVLLSIFAPSAFAAEGDMTDMMYKSLRMAFGWVDDIEVALIGEGGEKGERATFWARVLIWILLFALLHYALRMMNLQGNIAITVAFIIALISVVGIPGSLLRNIMLNYSIVASFILLIAPVLGLLLFRNRMKSQHGTHKWLHILFIAVDIMVLLLLNRFVVSYESNWEWITQIGMFFYVVMIGLIIMDVNDLFQSARGRYTPPASPQWLPGPAQAQQLTQRAERETADAETLADVQRRLGELETELGAVNAHLGRGGNMSVQQQQQLLQRLQQLLQENEQLRQQLGQ